MDFTAGYQHQIPLPDMPALDMYDTDPVSKCHSIWDPTRATFRECFFPVIATIPAIVAACILLTYALWPFEAYWPRWTQAFIKEKKLPPTETSANESRHHPYWTYTLLLIGLIGLGSQVSTIFFPSRQILAIYPSIAWTIIVMIILIDRPRTAPLSILILLVFLLITQLVGLSHSYQGLRLHDSPSVLVLVAAICSSLVILNMPLRDPRLPKSDISRPFSTSTSKLRSPEDNITPWQYMSVSWMAPLISEGVKRQINDDDVWDLPWEFKHGRLHEAFRQLRGSVTRRLLVANGRDLVFTTTLGLIELASSLSAPVLLQKILWSMENPDSPRSATITYACLSLALRLLSAQCGVFKLWYSRRTYERSRGEMMTMLYEKTLHRKILGVHQESKPEEHANGHANGSIEQSKAWYSRFRRLLKRLYEVIVEPFRKKKAEKDGPKEGASTGKILNLMRNDVYEVSQRFWDFPDLIINPLGIVFSVILIWKLLGWSCLLGVLVLAVSQGISILVSKYMIYWEKKRRVVTDEKLKKVTQFIESIRHLRWYGWEDTWLKGIMESRQQELHLRIIMIVFSTSLSFIQVYGSGLFVAVAFWAYTTIGGRSLRVDLIFPALSLFQMLERYLRSIPILVTVVLNAYVAMGRIETFMKEPDKEEPEVVAAESTPLELQKASFAWPGVSKNVLENVTLSFPTGLTVIYGEVAAGKTALLQALLGELDKTEGEFLYPGETIGYCAQTPWLQSMSIRENILFESPYEEARYQATLDACALLPDMASFKHGDMSNIGENGIGLSGGQKARVALARAVYSKAKVLFLDDPLSALDHQTAEYIVRKLIAGPLLEGRTTLLVTHRTELCHGIAKQWVEIDKGKATIKEPSEDNNMSSLKRTNTSESANDEESKKKKDEDELAAVPDKFIEDEKRAHGGVKLRVYWKYVKSGTWRWWLMAVVAIASFRSAEVAQTWFIKEWGEGYAVERASSGVFDRLPPPDEDIRPWLLVFLGFTTASAVLYFFTHLSIVGAGYQASKAIFREVIERVAHANFRFYDTTPVGRLMNRMTSDMNIIDGSLAFMITVIAWQFVSWFTSVIVIAAAAPAFLMFGVAMAAIFVYTFSRFLPTSQSLRRLEMVSLSPLMSNFGTLVEGLTTIRAFCAQPRFQERVIEIVDNFQKNDHFYWSLQAWLLFRFDALSATSTLMMTLIAVYTGISPGLTAFVLIAASNFVNSTHALCKSYGVLEMDFTSVERVVELLDLETEPPGVVSPPAWWPSYNGDIVFSDVTVRYAPHLEPALQNVSVRLPAGSNTAIIGRTGSGKSTLALSLLATIIAESGTITIDGIDIATVNRQTLRSRVTFLAQDPVLFPGTMRKNLDPLDQYTDAACEAVLSKIAGPHHNWTLSTPISAGGKGLSQGQRQLVGLARAMLRRSSVIILDEATASIDFETAQKIQEVLRQEMKESTVITIAHRLEAVKNADYCVVLGKGKVVKSGKAKDMLREGGELRGMLA